MGTSSCTGASLTDQGRTSTVATAESDMPRPSSAEYAIVVVPVASSGTSICTARPARTVLTSPREPDSPTVTVRTSPSWS